MTQEPGRTRSPWTGSPNRREAASPSTVWRVRATRPSRIAMNRAVRASVENRRAFTDRTYPASRSLLISLSCPLLYLAQAFDFQV